MTKLANYDAGLTLIDPTPMIQAGIGLQRDKVNRSNFYWHQRLNTDPCWSKVALKQFDKGNGMFNNISQYGFYKLVALAMSIHKAAVGFIATPEIRQAVSTSTKKSAFKKKVTTTVSYYLKPKWTVVTPSVTGTYSELVINPTQDRNGNYSFVEVKGEHNFPVDETLIYQWSKSKSGWTGLFVFLTSMFLGMLTGGLGGLSQIQWLNVFTGGAAGGVGGLIASGFSPTTSTTAHLTPFTYSAYELDPSINMSGDAKAVADRTRSNWVMPDAQNTPGGVQSFVMKIDIRKALACGGAYHATDACSSPAIEQLPLDDPRAKQAYEEMFGFPHKELQKYKYPYVPR